MSVSPPAARYRLRPSQIWQLVWLPLLIAAAAYLALVMIGRTVPFWQWWLLALAVMLGIHLTRALRGQDHNADVEHRVRAGLIVDRPFEEVNRWEERLSWGESDAERFRFTVQRRLVELITERLRLRHGVSLSGDPVRARAILGDALFQLATTPVAAAPTESEMDYLVRCIEEI